MALSRIKSLPSLINFSQILREFVPTTIMSRIISSGSLKEHGGSLLDPGPRPTL